MRTNGFFVTSMLAVAFLAGCTNTEELVTANSEEAIRITAGIGEPTRAVIDAGYGADLNVSFARIDNQPAGMNWNTPSIDAIRTGGAGNTAITFEQEQNYLAANGVSALIGYYPRKTPEAGTANPLRVVYTITGDEDIMATEIQTGWLAAPFEVFTFNHLLTQLQFVCVGSAEAVAKWTATGATDKSLPVKNCPATVSVVGQATPRTGYLMLYPVADMGTVAAAIDLEVKATYGGEVKTLPVSITNIDGGVQAGQSHLITLTFAEDGTIIAEAGIAVWQPGNGGSSIITPGE
ncbi:hypothetical protein [Parabacteroides goldsteinii]|uniref:hypothetical protein n=1 Tax=Parabacteroides goldsteinii TaxID=328812 RepID=UPI0034A28D37